MLLRITGQHKTRNVVKRTVHWNRMEPNRLRTEPTRTVLRFLSDFANLHEPKRTAGSLHQAGATGLSTLDATNKYMQ